MEFTLTNPRKIIIACRTGRYKCTSPQLWTSHVYIVTCMCTIACCCYLILFITVNDSFTFSTRSKYRIVVTMTEEVLLQLNRLAWITSNYNVTPISYFSQFPKESNYYKFLGSTIPHTTLKEHIKEITELLNQFKTGSQGFSIFISWLFVASLILQNGFFFF